MFLNNMKEAIATTGLDWFQISVTLGICFIVMWMTLIKHSSLKFKNVVIANTFEECQSAINILSQKCATYRAIGFDCEWTTFGGGRSPIALLQLASVDGYCVLVRFNHLQRAGCVTVPSNLKELLEDRTILKVGVVPSNDADYLFNDYNIIVRGCLDLRYLVMANGGEQSGGLAGLTESVLGLKMDKSWIVRCSDWERPELSERQVLYAANDAWYAVKIFEVLALGKLKWRDCNILDLFRSHWRNICEESFIPSNVWSFVDCKFQTKKTYTGESSEFQGEAYIPPTNFSHKSYKSSKVIPRAFCTRQMPLYQNCFMQAPDGAVLCTCDRKKAMWYVSKNLADLIKKEPLTVRLKFEPSGRAVGSVGQYYVQTKSNCCVVCGKFENCVRKNIVPHEYRKHFPNIMKDHVSHDVLLMCLPCHLRSNSFDLIFKRRLADLCGAPFCQGGNSKFMLNREKSAVKAAAKALLRNCEKIPIERQEVLKETVKDYFNVSQLTHNILREAASMNAHTPNEDYDPHGMKIVQFFSDESNGGLVKLEQMWREHFLRTMRPKYMPNLWSVTHTQDRLAIRASENRVLEKELCVAGMKQCVPLLEFARSHVEQRQQEM